MFFVLNSFPDKDQIEELLIVTVSFCVLSTRAFSAFLLISSVLRTADFYEGMI